MWHSNRQGAKLKTDLGFGDVLLVLALPPVILIVDYRITFSPSHAYYHSKLAQIMFTYELARRLEGTGIAVNCIRVSNVKIDEGRYERADCSVDRFLHFTDCA